MTDKIQEIIFGSWFSNSLQESYESRLANRRETLSMESEAGLDSIKLPGVKYKGVEIQAISIRYTGKGRRITLARFLCGLVTFFPEEVERVHILLMYDNFLHIQDLAEKDENFKRKFGEDLESLAKILKSFRLQKSTTGLEVKKLGAQMKKDLVHFILPERNVKQVATRIGEMFTFKPTFPSGVPNSQLKPKAYIGKGYTDQGTARNAARDNSPSWQEVAMHRTAGEEDEEN